MSKRSPSRSARQRYSRAPEAASALQQRGATQQAEVLTRIAPPSPEPHAAFAAHASGFFGNRVVAAALADADRGPSDDVAGPESLIHSILALGAAGVRVGDTIFTAFGNDRLASVLSGGMDPWAPELMPAGESAGGPEVSDASFGQDLWEQTVETVLARRPGAGSSGGGSAQAALQAADQSGGRSLPSHVRAELEARFGGADFSGVRIHTDGAAQSAASAIDAAAYTMGTDIWFGPGQFAPDTAAGMHLLAHELTHVLQNLRGDARSGSGGEVDGVAVSMPSDPRELEAEAVAHDVMRGEVPDIAADPDLAGGAGGAGLTEAAPEGAVAERTLDMGALGRRAVRAGMDPTQLPTGVGAALPPELQQGLAVLQQGAAAAQRGVAAVEQGKAGAAALQKGLTNGDLGQLTHGLGGLAGATQGLAGAVQGATNALGIDGANGALNSAAGAVGTTHSALAGTVGAAKGAIGGGVGAAKGALGGLGLPEAVQGRMGAVFGNAGHQAAAGLNAQAFAYGANVLFGQDHTAMDMRTSERTDTHAPRADGNVTSENTSNKDGNTGNPKGTGPKKPEGNTTHGTSETGNTTDGTSGGTKTPDGKNTDGKNTDGKSGTGKTPDEKNTDGKNTDGKTSGTPGSPTPGSPEALALGPAVQQALSLGIGPTSVVAPTTGPTPSARELPRLPQGTLKVSRDQDAELKRTTGMTAEQHRQAIAMDTEQLRSELRSLQDDARRYAAEQTATLSSELDGHLAQAEATSSSALTALSTAFSDSRSRVADAVTSAHGAIDGAAASARAQLNAALPGARAQLTTAYDNGRAALAGLRTRWVGPFDQMVDEQSQKFIAEAETAATELAAKKADILKAWPTNGNDHLINAENEARQKSAAAGIDKAVADFRAGGRSKAAAVVAQKPSYRQQISDLIAPVEAQFEASRQQGESAINAAHTQALQRIDSERGGAHSQVEGAHRTALGTLDGAESEGRGQVDAARTRLASDIEGTRVSVAAQIDAAVAGLENRYADWMQGVLDGIPTDQPMPYATAQEYLRGKRTELARFHQQIENELLGVCDRARGSIAGSVTSTNDHIRALAEGAAGRAGGVADTQVAAIQQASGSFAQSMTAVGGAVDVAVQQHVAPVAGTVGQRVAATDAGLQTRKEAAARDIDVQVQQYGQDLRTQIATMADHLRPAADAAARAVRPQLVARAEKVYKACKGLGTDENMLNDGLRGLTALSSKALEFSVWPDLHQAEGGLRAFIEDDVSGTDLKIANAYLAGDVTRGAQLELNNSMHWYGDDEAQIEKVLRELTPEQRRAMQNQPGWTEVRARLESNLGGTDLDVTKALLAGNDARADAYRLRDKINEARMSNDPDALHAALDGVDPQQLAAVQQEFHNIQNNVDPEATNVPAIDPDVAAKELGDFSTRHIRGAVDLQGPNRNLTEALATKGRDSDAAAIHRFEVERTRPGGPDQANLEKALYANPALQEQLHDPDPQVRARAQEEQRARETRIREGYATAYGNGNANAMRDNIAKMYTGESDAPVRQRMVQNMLADGTNSPRVAADSIYLNAAGRAGTDEAALKRALGGMRPDEIQATQQIYAQEHGNGDANAMARDLGIVERNPDGTRKEGGDHSGIGSELSGDDRREIEELMMGDPRYHTPQQQLALARLQRDWTVGDESTMIGRGLLSGTNERADLDRNFARLEAAATQMNPDGSFKGATPEERAANQLAFERAAGDAGINANNYRAAGDRTAGYITTAIAVVGAVVITAATFGAGAPAGAALIAAAGAAGTGLANMGVNYAMKGGRYGWEQGATDLAMTAVSTATAGAGGYLSAVNGGGGILANSSVITSKLGQKVAGDAIVGLGSGLINGAAGAATTDGTWDRGFTQGMKTVALDAGKQGLVESVSGAVSSRVDEGAWGEAMQNRSLMAGTLAKGTSESVASVTSTAAGMGYDSARGKSQGESWDIAQTLATEGGKGFVTGVGGNLVNRRYMDPSTQTHVHHPENNAGAPHAHTEPGAQNGTPHVDAQNGAPRLDPATHTHTEQPMVPHTDGSRDGLPPARRDGDHADPARTPTDKGGVELAGDQHGLTATVGDRTVVSNENGAVSTHADGTQEIRSKDGTLTRIAPDGSHTTVLPDGTIILETATGDRAQITRDGQYVPLGPDGKPLKDASPTVNQREDALVTSLQTLVDARKISQDDAMRVIAAGDIDAQQRALGQLSEHVQTQDRLLDNVIALSRTQGPDGKPLISPEDIDAAFSQQDPERALQLLEARVENRTRDSRVADDVHALPTTTTTGTDGAASQHVTEVFDQITLGAGTSAIAAEVSHRQNAGADAEGGGKRLIVGDGNPFDKARPDTEGVVTTDGVDPYTQARKHAEDAALARHANDIGVYSGDHGAVETRPVDAGSEWPPGAQMRVPVTGPDGQVRYLYAKHIDVGGASPKAATQVQDRVPSHQVLEMDHVAWAADPVAQRTLYEAAQQAVTRMRAAGAEVTADMQGAEVVSLLKRENFDDFVSEVLKKQQTKDYASMGEMSDIIRGRFNLQTGEDVALVAQRLQDAFQGSIVEVKEPRPGYPRWHINVRDAETGLVHEWQVGTNATTRFYETNSLEIPSSIHTFGGHNNFHDGVYKLLDKVRDPVARSEYGIDDLMDRYARFAEETGKVTSDAPLPADFERRYQQFSDEISATLRRIESERPGYMDEVLSGKGKTPVTDANSTTPPTPLPPADGSAAAKALGWPAPPEGYVYVLDGSGGQPTLQRALGSADRELPRLRFDSTDGTFVDLDTGLRFTNASEVEALVRVRETAKGSRPLPASYLGESFVQSHLEHFDGGAVYLVPKDVLDRYGRASVGRGDGQFVMSKAEMDAMLDRCGGDAAAIERELGIPAGAWQGRTLVRIDISDPRALNLRMASGNENGANDLWLPGGRLPTGQREAVVDAIPEGSYTETVVVP